MEKDEVCMLIDQNLARHLREEPHDKSPCETFKEHRSQLLWLLGVIGTLAVVLGGYFWGQMERTTLKAEHASSVMIRVETKLDYLAADLQEIKQTVKSELKEIRRP